MIWTVEIGLVWHEQIQIRNLIYDMQWNSMHPKAAKMHVIIILFSLFSGLEVIFIRRKVLTLLSNDEV